MVRRNGLKIVVILIMVLAGGMTLAAPAARAENVCQTQGYDSPECRAFVAWASTHGYQLTPVLIDRIKNRLELAKPRIMLQAKSWADGRRIAFALAQRVVLDYYGRK
jgi:hypothetical protein